jgi:hypothetical protein
MKCPYGCGYPMRHVPALTWFGELLRHFGFKCLECPECRTIRYTVKDYR